MKYPILYEENEKVFTHLGLGPLTNTLKAHVAEERNGAFYLDMEVLVDDIKYPLLQEDRIIKADAGHILKDQRFRIKKIVPKEDNKAEVYAEHVSYLAEELSLKPETGATGTADSAIKTWKGNIIDKNDFIVDSDITTVSSATWKINEVKNAREALGGVKGSILDRWGGEYRFDNYHISLLKKRGKTAETLLAYGRNITDFEQERNIKNTYNAVYPFVVYREDDKNDDVIFTLKDYIVDSKYVANYPNRKALPVDFSSEFKDGEKPTAEKLKRLAEQYIVNNEIGVPTVSIKLKFIDLSKTLDYEELAPLEQLNLCDDVRIVYPKLGVDTVSKVIRVVWDHLTEKYYELEIGQKRLTLSNIIREQETAINEIHTETNHALLAANGKNTNFYGLYGENGLGEPTATRIDDTWFKPNGEHTEMYRWDGFFWKFIFSTAPDNSIIEKIEELEEVSKDTQEKADQAIEDAGFSKIEISKINKELIEITADTDVALDEARQAKQQAFNSEQLANSAKQDAILAIQKGDQNSSQITVLEGGMQLTNTKVDGNTAQISTLKSDSERLSSTIGKVEADLENMEIGILNLASSKHNNTTSKPSDYWFVTIAEAKSQTGFIWKPNTEYTIVMNGRVLEEGSILRWYVQHPPSYDLNQHDSVQSLVNTTTSKTFKTPNWEKPEAASLNVYNYTKTGGVQLNWIMVFEGNKAPVEYIQSQFELTTKQEFSNFEQTYKGFQQTVNNDISGLKSQQTQMSGQISSVIKDVNGLESEVIQLSDQITQTVNKVETVDGKVTNQQSQITQLSDQINSKVDKTDFDSLTGTVTQQGTEIAQLSDRITQTVTKIESVDGKVVAQQTQINQMSDKIELVVKEQTELNTKYSKIEQTTDTIRSEVVEMGKKVDDIGTYVNYLINADDFSDSLPYSIGMSGPQLSLVKAEMAKGNLKITQDRAFQGYIVLANNTSSLELDTEYTFSGNFKKASLDIRVYFEDNFKVTSEIVLSEDGAFSLTFRTPKEKKIYYLYIKCAGTINQTSSMSAMKLNKGSKRVENTVDTASLNARISKIEQTSNGLKSEVAVIKNDQIVQSSQITQLSDNINLRVEKNKVISQINISPETIRLESKLIHLSGKSLIDDAVIKSAMIESMTANKLTAGIIDAAQITVINMNANNITTGVLKAIDITGSTITGSTFTTVGTATAVVLKQGLLTISHNNNGMLARFGYNSTWGQGLSLEIPKGLWITGTQSTQQGFFALEYRNGKMWAWLPEIRSGITCVDSTTSYYTADYYADPEGRAAIVGYDGVFFGERNSGGTINQLGEWRNNQLEVFGSLKVRGSKNAIHETSQGWVATPAYETAESYLGDIGTATTDENGNVVIFIDELFSEIINTEEHEYHVFLQSYRYESPVFVLNRNEKYFTVKSKLPQTVFAYELKAKRRGYETDRLKKVEE